MMTISFIVYNLIFFLGLIIFIPLHMAAGKLDFVALLQKSGFYPRRAEEVLGRAGGSIWIHAVSVGEVRLVKNLLRALAKTRPETIVLTTTTLTGKEVAQKLYPDLVNLYFPFDLSCILNRAISRIKPKVFVAIETEIWPNLYAHLKQRRIPVLILNGRISDRAFARYKKVRFLVKKIFSLVDFVGVQNRFYANRFIALGLDPAKVTVSGNLKFSRVECSPETANRVRLSFGPVLKKNNRQLLVAASTHSGEEEMVIEAYKKVRTACPALVLLLAPRHVRRAEEIGEICAKKKVDCAWISKAGGDSEAEVFILDTVGDLVSFFTLADICFVGGSLLDFGGHNILEPMSFSVPTLFGPYMSNFKEVRDKALEHKAAIQVNDQRELAAVLEDLAGDKGRRQNLAEASAALFREGEEILEKNRQMVSQWLK